MTFSYRYRYAFHWTVTQFIGRMEVQVQNHDERLFAVLALIFTFVYSAWFISDFTSLITRLSIVYGDNDAKLAALRRYLIHRNVSRNLLIRVSRGALNALAMHKQKIQEQDVELFGMLARQLQIAVHMDMYEPMLIKHPFFYGYANKRSAGFNMLCHIAVSWVDQLDGDKIFYEGQVLTAPKMFFSVNGGMVYERWMATQGSHDDSSCTAILPENLVEFSVGVGDWLCELAMWMRWEHLGTLIAGSHGSSVLALYAAAFTKIATDFRGQTWYPALYAQAVVSAINELADVRHLDDLNYGDLDIGSVAFSVFGVAPPSNRFTRFRLSSRSSSDTTVGRTLQWAKTQTMELSRGLSSLR